MTTDLYTKNSFFTLSGASGGVWLFTTVMASVFFIDVDKHRWIGLVVALAISFLGAFRLRKMDLQLTTIAFFNGLLIFVTASGIDAINSGVPARDKDRGAEKQSNLIPFTDNISWWPTQKLVDSVTHLTAINEKLVYRYEELEKQASEIKEGSIDYSHVSVFLAPKTIATAAGGTIEFDIILAPWSHTPKITHRGNTLTFNTTPSGENVANLKFLAEGVKFDATGSATIKDKLEIHPPVGDPYSLPFHYFVIQTVIKITTGNAPTLYMNCGNLVNIEVPSLGSNYNPKFSSANAEIIPGEKPGLVTIIPNAAKISVSISQGSQTVGTQAFDVKRVPSPRIVVYDGTKPVDLAKGITPNRVSALRIVVESDENFKEEVPKDARFRIKLSEVILARGTQAIMRTELRGDLNLNNFVNACRPGDRIVITIHQIVRINYKDEEVLLSLGIENSVITIPIY